MSIHPFAPGSRLFKAFHECRVAVSTANYSKSAWEELESAIDAAICPSPDHPEMVARREAWGKICAAVASVAAAAVEASKPEAVKGTMPETIESVAEATARFEKYLSGLGNFAGGFRDSAKSVANEAASIFGRVPAACRVSVSHENLDGVCKAISDRIHGAGCWAADFVLEVVKDEMARIVPPKPEAPVREEEDSDGNVYASKPTTVYLDAPETWIAQAKEALEYIRAHGRNEDIPKWERYMGGLVHFIAQCKAEEPDVGDLAASNERLTAEVHRLTEHNRAVDKRLDEARAPCPECAKLVEFFTTEEPQDWRDAEEAGRSAVDCIIRIVRRLRRKIEVLNSRESVPLVAATERRANALEQIKRLQSMFGTTSNIADCRRIRDFIESTVPADEPPPYLVTGAEAAHAKLAIDTIEGYGHFREGQDGWAGIKVIREFIAKFLPPPKPAFELPPPGTLFKAVIDLPDGGREEATFCRMPNGSVVDELGSVWRGQDFGMANPVLVAR